MIYCCLDPHVIVSDVFSCLLLVHVGSYLVDAPLGRS